jgi:hypothetical protein
MTPPTLVVQLQGPRWWYLINISVLCFSLGMTVRSCQSEANSDESEAEGCDDSIVTVSRERER